MRFHESHLSIPNTRMNIPAHAVTACGCPRVIRLGSTFPSAASRARHQQRGHASDYRPSSAMASIGLQRRVRRAERPYPAASTSMAPETRAEMRGRERQAGEGVWLQPCASLIGSAGLPRAEDSAWIAVSIACLSGASRVRSLEWSLAGEPYLVHAGMVESSPIAGAGSVNYARIYDFDDLQAGEGTRGGETTRAAGRAFSALRVSSGERVSS